MASASIDYDALARQSGAISSTPPPAAPPPVAQAIDYDALAKQSGAISSTPAPPAANAAPAPAAPSVGGFFSNAVDSAGKFLSNTGHAIAHPVDTLNALGNVAEGAANEYVPGYQAHKPIGNSPQDVAQQNAAVDAFKKNLIERYGSLDKFGHTLYTDPVGTLADVSALAGGVSGAARGVGAVADLASAGDVASGAARVARAANTVSDVTNPLTPITKAAGAVSNVIKPVVAKAAEAIPKPGFEVQLDPAEASAVAYGHDAGVQMPTSVQTGSKVAANAENILQNLPLASSVAKTARAAEQSTLAAAGAREVQAVGVRSPEDVEFTGRNPDGSPVTVQRPVPTPLDAGEAIHAQLDKNIAKHNAAANDSYDLLRSIEAQPQFKATVQTGTKLVDSGMLDEAGNPTTKRVPVMEDIQLPVPLRPVKEALKPIYDRMMRQMPVAQQQASAGLKAISNIVNGPDFESASITDENLGAIKQIARDTNSPVGQGLAKLAVKQLDQAVRSTVERAGPDAVAALEQGRESTIAKYQTSNLKDDLPASAVDLVNKLTAPADKSIDLLRRVAEATPEHIPALAQAVTQGLLDKVTAEAGMGKAQSALTAWNKLGDETKSILFKTPQQTQRLTDFFTLAKKLAENPNPSGSGSLLAMVKGVGLVLTQPHIGVPLVIGVKPLARMLFTPTEARNLILGLKMPAKSGPAGVQLSDQILRAAAHNPVRDTPNGPSTTAASDANIAHSGSGSGGSVSGGAPGVSAEAGGLVRGATADSPAGSGGAGGARSGGTTQGGGSRGLRSSSTLIPVPGGSGAGAYPAQYRVKELADLQASHNGLTFEPNAKYRLRNDRDYANQVNQDKIVAGASRSQFNPALHLTDNPDATNGPIITDAQGQVLGGNGRKMMLDRVHAGNLQGATAYRAMLEAKAEQFGIDPAEVARMQQPVLTREIPDSEFAGVRSKQEAVTDFNKKGTAELTPGERAIADSRRVSTDTLDDMAARLDAKGPSATVADVLEGKPGGEVLSKLIDDGVVTPQERAAFMDSSGELTKAGKDRISQFMVGRFFKDPAQLDTMAPSVRNKVERAAAPLAQVEAKPGWDLTPDVKTALDMIDQARRVGVKSISDFLAQEGLFAKQKYSENAVTLAKALQTSKQSELTAAARQYAQDAAYAAKGDSLLGDTPTPAQSFADSFGKLKSGAQSDAAKIMAQAKGQKTIAVGGTGAPGAVASAEGASEIGPHGPIFREHTGDWAAARDRLLSERTGEVPGALLHPKVPPVDLIWGQEGDTAGKGFGLAKIEKWHPEVLENLGDIYSSLPVVERNENTIQLDNGRYHATIRRNWKGDAKNWLLTAFDKTAGK